MARIRTIKPEFFTSLTIADLTPEQRLTFIGLWTHVDDAGRCVDDPRLIKAALWPLDDRTAADIEIDLKALTESSLITRYALNRKRYLAVTNWEEHQRINRPSASKIPSPEEGELLSPGAPNSGARDSPTPHGAFSEGSNRGGGPGPEGAWKGPGVTPGDPAVAQAAPGPEGAGETSSSDAVTGGDASSTGDSLSPHAQLHEGSPPERNRERNREQGTGRGKGGAGDRGSRPATPPARSRPDGRTHIDDEGFELTDAMRRWSLNTLGPNLDVDHETEQFISHHRAEGTRRRSWPDEWQKWMRRSAKWASERANRPQLRAVSGGYTPHQNPTDDSVWDQPFN